MRTRRGGRRAGIAAALAAAVVVACGLEAPEKPAPAGAPAPPPPEPPVALPPPGAPPPADPLPVGAVTGGWRLVWRDEFDGVAVDTSKWRIWNEPRGDAFATPDAIAVRDGVATFTTYTEAGVTRTGFLSSDLGRFEATYGHFEARIRFRGAPGEWCAFWLNSPTIGVPLGDPGRAGAEIDVVEHRVTDQNGWALADMVQQNVIWDGYARGVRKDVAHVVPLPSRQPVNGAWHTYAVEWDAQGYVFYVDDDEIWRTSTAVSNRSEHVLLTCEVLEEEWAGDVPPGGYGPRATSTTGMDVDWVRVWQKG
jgi:beta-glucanase (GH16 family)